MPHNTHFERNSNFKIIWSQLQDARGEGASGVVYTHGNNGYTWRRHNSDTHIDPYIVIWHTRNKKNLRYAIGH